MPGKRWRTKKKSKGAGPEKLSGEENETNKKLMQEHEFFILAKKVIIKQKKRKKREMGRARRRRGLRTKKHKYARKYFAVFFLFALAAGFWLWWSVNLQPAAETGQNQAFVLKAGMSAADTAIELKKMKIIRSSEAFTLLCRLNQADAKLVAGVYYLSPAQGSRNILNLLIEGPDKEVIRITIPEGYTVAQIVDTLAKDGLGSKTEFYQAMQTFTAKDYSFLRGALPGNNTLEGFLFPDTYFFDKRARPREIIDRFLQRFKRELDKKTMDRLSNLNLSIRDWVIKASLVEKEAAKQQERALIAGVFNNRLRLGMRLESCATVQYVLGEVKPVLSLADIEIDSPYNTYKHDGLPPGPIANPGDASLQAVLYPQKTGYLFFAAKNDGSHAFAVTFEEHLQNVGKYQKK